MQARREPDDREPGPPVAEARHGAVPVVGVARALLGQEAGQAGAAGAGRDLALDRAQSELGSAHLARNLRRNCAWLKLARLGVDGMNMQRILTAGLVLLAVALSAGGVAFSVRADSSQASGQCSTATTKHEVRVNARAAELAAKDDVVPLNTSGYNYNTYEDQWRPERSDRGAERPRPPPAAARE